MTEYVIRRHRAGKTTTLLQWLGDGEPIKNAPGWSRVILVADQPARRHLQFAAKQGHVALELLRRKLEAKGFTGELGDLVVTLHGWRTHRDPMAVELGIDNLDLILPRLISGETGMITATGTVREEPNPLGNYVDVVFRVTIDQHDDPKSLRFIEAEINGKSARFPFVSLPGGTKALRIPVDEDVVEYRRLADKVIDLFNPPDEDADEGYILEKALGRIAEYVADTPCTCPADADGAYQACRRCFVLGRLKDEAVDR